MKTSFLEKVADLTHAQFREIKKSYKKKMVFDKEYYRQYYKNKRKVKKLSTDNI